jgi:hypothetical protein
MSKFKVGDEVTMKKTGLWVLAYGPVRGSKPKFGKTYHVGVVGFQDGHWHIGLIELGIETGWHEDAFEKVISDRVLHEELETVKEPYTI